MTGKNKIQNTILTTPTISSEMANAIELWSNMYKGLSPWIKEPTLGSPVRIASLGLPALIASEKARLVTLEMESEINAPTEEVEEENPDYAPPSIDDMGNISMGRGAATIKKDVPKGNTERADFLNEEYKKLMKHIRRQLEYGIAKGGLVIKPYIILKDGFTESSNDTNTEEKPDTTEKTESKNNDIQTKPQNSSTTTKSKTTNTYSSNKGVQNIDNNVENKEKPQVNASIEFDFVQADGFYPLAFDANGRVTEAAFVQRKIDKDIVYSRVEYHKLENNMVTVTNSAFKLHTTEADTRLMKSDLGTEVSLTEVPEWASLQPITQIKDVDRLLFAYFRMPDANTIDPYSPLGVSGYSRVVDLIRDADYQYSRLLWEYEGGELAIDVDRDALKFFTDSQGNDRRVLPMSQERLFRKVDLNQEDTYNVFAPNLRDTNYIQGLNVILMRIEDAVGLSRGTISEQSINEAKTATELKILKQRSFAANRDIQMALEDALRDVIYIMDVYCSLYKVTPEGEYDVSFEWDDSILSDSESELAQRLSLLQNDLTSRVETRMWFFGETENQAKLALQKIEDEKKTAMETNMMAQSQLGEVAQQQSNEALEGKQSSNTVADGGKNPYNNTAQAAANKQKNNSLEVK